MFFIIQFWIAIILMILLKNNSQRSYSTLNVDKFLFGKDEVEMMTNKPKAWITSWGIVFQKNDKNNCDSELNKWRTFVTNVYNGILLWVNLVNNEMKIYFISINSIWNWLAQICAGQSSPWRYLSIHISYLYMIWPLMCTLVKTSFVWGSLLLYKLRI